MCLISGHKRETPACWFGLVCGLRAGPVGVEQVARSVFGPKLESGGAGETELWTNHEVNTARLLGLLVTESQVALNSHRNIAQGHCHHRLMTHNSLHSLWLDDISFLLLAYNQAVVTAFYHRAADDLINNCRQ